MLKPVALSQSCKLGHEAWERTGHCPQGESAHCEAAVGLEHGNVARNLATIKVPPNVLSIGWPIRPNESQSFLSLQRCRQGL